MDWPAIYAFIPNKVQKVFFQELVLKVLHNLIMFTLLFEELVEAISSEA